MIAFRFISADIINGWLQVIAEDGSHRSIKLAAVLAFEHDNEHAAITVYSAIGGWKLASGISQSKAMDVHVGDARREEVAKLHDRLCRELIRGD